MQVKKQKGQETRYYIFGQYGESRVKHLMLGLDDNFNPTIRKEFLDSIVMKQSIEAIRKNISSVSIPKYGPFLSDLHLSVSSEKPEWLMG